MISAELVAGTDKRDSRGRRLAGEERRLAVLAAYDRTGLTQRAFAEQEGVRHHTLVTWLTRGVFRLQPLQPPQFAYPQAGVLLLPTEIGLLRHTHLATDVADLGTCLDLA